MISLALNKNDLSSPFIPGNAEGRDYQCVLRVFANGDVEASTKCIQSLQRMQFARAWLGHNPVKVCMDVEELTDEQEAEKAADNRARAVRRARQRVRWLVKSGRFDHMLTLSYRENMTDVKRLKTDWDVFVRAMHAKYPDWKFCAVREYQERGALHLHVACVGKQDIRFIRRCWYKTLGASPEATGDATPGQIDVTGPRRHWGNGGYQWRADKLAGYLTKYLGKAFDVGEANAKRYWQSKGIEKPVVTKIWLGAASYVGAVVETHGIVTGAAGGVATMWASEGYEAIWMTG